MCVSSGVMNLYGYTHFEFFFTLTRTCWLAHNVTLLEIRDNKCNNFYFCQILTINWKQTNTLGYQCNDRKRLFYDCFGTHISKWKCKWTNFKGTILICICKVNIFGGDEIAAKCQFNIAKIFKMTTQVMTFPVYQPIVVTSGQK